MLYFVCVQENKSFNFQLTNNFETQYAYIFELVFSYVEAFLVEVIPTSSFSQTNDVQKCLFFLKCVTA